mgnify:CR=1 FL=1
MDLGATLCTRTKPVCTECPVRGSCKAFKNETVELFPGRRPKLKITKKSFHMLILTDSAGNILLERRPPVGIWGGLWSLPADDDGNPIRQRLGLDQHKIQTLPDLQHQLTHINMTIHPLIAHAEPSSRGVECRSNQRWFGRNEWQALGLPKPVRQLLEIYLENSEA